MDTLPILDYIEQQMVRGPRDGETYNEKRDRKRLDTAAERVFAVMKDKNWHTLSEIAAKCRCSEACASARIRDLRKPQFGGWNVIRQNRGGGLWAYCWTGEKA